MNDGWDVVCLKLGELAVLVDKFRLFPDNMPKELERSTNSQSVEQLDLVRRDRREHNSTVR